VKTAVKLKEHTYSYDKIVVGGNLNAVLYAYKTNSVFICNTDGCPFPFDKTSNDITLGPIKFPKGTYKRDIRNKLLYDMALAGRVPYGDKVTSLAIDEAESEISILKNFSRGNFSRFSSLRIFDLEGVSGIDYEPPKILGYRVFDWYDVRSGMKHQHDFITDDSDFCKKIHFYLSWRVDGNYDKKDLVCESFLSEQQLNDVDYSDSISRLKTLDMMRKADIKGAGNGTGRWLPIKLELWKREVFPVKKLDYIKKNNIVIDNRSTKDVLLEG
jgi:hypothetical protein